MHDWVTDLLACPAGACGGRLVVRPGGRTSRDQLRDGVLGCRLCSAVYPVLGGVPVIVANPAAWAARYRDSILAALAESQRASKQAVELVEVFADAAAAALPDSALEPMRFGDDWVADEAAGFDADAVPGDRPATGLFRAFVSEAAVDDPVRVVLRLLGGRAARLGTVIELGTGAGFLGRALRARADRLVVADLSLRAVLRAARYAGRGAGAPVAGAVIDADTLALHKRKVDTIAAANLIDLLDDPSAFLAAAAAGLKKRGSLVLTTPDPSLGTSDDGALDDLLDGAGFAAADQADGVPWLRPHSDRHVQVYFSRVVLAQPL